MTARPTLSDTHPDVAATLVLEPGGVRPGEVTYGSNREALWRCPEGHLWRMSVARRVKGARCPDCVREERRASSLALKCPDVAAEMVLRPGDPATDELAYASNKRMLWECSKGHRWEAPVVRRTRGHGCPECAEKRRTRVSAAEARPELVALLDTEASGFTLEEVGNCSNRIGHFECPEGHRWTKRIGSTAAGRCPECPRGRAPRRARTARPEPNPTGPRLRKGSIALAVTHPELATQWDHAKNAPYTPENVSAGSNRRMWWICDKGHSWDAPVANRINYGCPVCYGRRVLAGYNDAATTHPELADEFDAENSEYGLDEVTYGSDKKLAWKCSRGHRWVSTPYGKKGCPTCDGKQVEPGYNDLASLFPEVACGWDHERNDLSPDEVTSRSSRKVWWICRDHPEHRWKATCSDRVAGKSHCPECSAADRRSKGEREVETFLRGLGVTDIRVSHRRLIHPYELDLYLPEYKTAIEFNGIFWHSDRVLADRNHHHDKWARCRDTGVQLLTIWEDDWQERRPVVEAMIAHKLGLSAGPRLAARGLNVVTVDASAARAFLDNHHIQGFSSGSLYVGLIHPEHHLVAVSVWRRDGSTLYLDRYATSATIMGGMGRLLSVGKRYAVERGCTRIVTFADHAVSNGDLYDKLGFNRDGEIPPDYSYLVGGSRVHKFNYRKSRFRRDPDLLWGEGLTERELAELNGLARIWDCGKTRWVLSV